MKCVCGYEYYYDGCEDNRYVAGVEEEKFILVNLVATISRDFEPDKTVSIYACPACGTLQLKDF